jgi:hypothetical protein
MTGHCRRASRPEERARKLRGADGDADARTLLPRLNINIKLDQLQPSDPATEYVNSASRL